MIVKKRLSKANSKIIICFCYKKWSNFSDSYPIGIANILWFFNLEKQIIGFNKLNVFFFIHDNYWFGIVILDWFINYFILFCIYFSKKKFLILKSNFVLSMDKKYYQNFEHWIDLLKTKLNRAWTTFLFCWFSSYLN